MFRIYLPSAAALASVMAATSASAQNSSSDTDVIVVEATRRALPPEDLPQKVRLIDREALRDQLAVSISLLDTIGQKVPSISPTRQKLSGLGESFRGREPLYLIDGVPQSNPLRNGSRDGFTLDPAVVERVEILFGANAIQGVGATGGVINYVTLAPSVEDRWQARAEAGVTVSDELDGDGTGLRTAAAVLRDFGETDLVASLAIESRGAFYDAEGERVGVDTTQGDIQDSLSLNGFAKLGWEPDALTRLQLTVNAFRLEGDGDYVPVSGDRMAGIPATSVLGEAEGEPAENEVLTISLDARRDDVAGGRLSVQAFYQDFRSIFGGGVFGVFQDEAFAPIGELFEQSANDSEKLGLKLGYANDVLPIEGLGLTTGVDLLRDVTFQELIRTGRDWVPETEFRSVAPFVQLDQELLDGRALVSGGIRLELVEVTADGYRTLASYGAPQVDGGSQSFTEPLSNLGGTFDLTRGLTAYASYAEGFTMPDVGRVLRGIEEIGADFDTLLDVEPIVTDNTELGLSLDQGQLEASLSFFWSDSALSQRLVPDADGIFSVSRERTEIEGLEASLDWTATDWLRLGGGYATIEARYDSDGDDEVDADLSGVNVSPDRLNLYAEAGPWGPASMRLQGSRFFDRTFDDEGTETDFDGYTLVDLLGSLDLGEHGGRIDLGVQNLADEQYLTYYSQAGTTSDARYFAGRGRTWTLRWSSVF